MTEDNKLRALLALQQAVQSENAAIQRINRLTERIKENEQRCGLKLALKLAVAYTQGAQISAITRTQYDNFQY